MSPSSGSNGNQKPVEVGGEPSSAFGAARRYTPKHGRNLQEPPKLAIFGWGGSVKGVDMGGVCSEKCI
jgi:hypothetical protein